MPQTQVFLLPFSLKQNLSPIDRAPPQEHQNFQVLPWIPRTYRTERNVETDRQAVTPLLQTNSAPLQLRWLRRYPCHHHQKQQIQAGFLLYASTPARANDLPHLAYVVWAQDTVTTRLQRACS